MDAYDIYAGLYNKCGHGTICLITVKNNKPFELYLVRSDDRYECLVAAAKYASKWVNKDTIVNIISDFNLAILLVNLEECSTKICVKSDEGNDLHKCNVALCKVIATHDTEVCCTDAETNSTAEYVYELGYD